MPQNLEKLVEEVSKKHAEILDSFAKAYLASRWKDYFSRQKNIDFRRVELCHQIKSPTEHVYWFRLKKGKLPKGSVKNPTLKSHKKNGTPVVVKKYLHKTCD